MTPDEFAERRDALRSKFRSVMDAFRARGGLREGEVRVPAPTGDDALEVHLMMAEVSGFPRCQSLSPEGLATSTLRCSLHLEHPAEVAHFSPCQGGKTWNCLP